MQDAWESSYTYYAIMPMYSHYIYFLLSNTACFICTVIRSHRIITGIHYIGIMHLAYDIDMNCELSHVASAVTKEPLCLQAN
jgi:hypothetical protein